MTYQPELPAHPWLPPFQKACHIPDNSAPYHKNTACNYCLIHDIPYTKYAPECSQLPRHSALEIRVSPHICCLFYAPFLSQTYLLPGVVLVQSAHFYPHKEMSHQSSATSRPAFP